MLNQEKKLSKLYQNFSKPYYQIPTKKPGFLKLLVFAVFFAVLFGVWSPLTSKSGIDDRSLSLENSLMTSKNSQSPFTSQQESVYSNYASDHHKSRVLLSTDEYDQYHHGPYLPSNNKYKSTNHNMLFHD